MARAETGYTRVMQELMTQYDRAWEKARAEEIRTGIVSAETESEILTIELEMEMLQNAV